MNRGIILGILLLLMGFATRQAPTPYVFPTLRFFPPIPTHPDNQVTNEGVALGRFLFYDPILSRDSSISCSSCHQQQYAFSDAPKQFSVGINQRKGSRNSPALFNLAWYPQLFWDGRANSIETQVFEPIRNHTEMGLDWNTVIKRLKNSYFYPPLFEQVFGTKKIDSIQVTFAIAQFERTLLSYNSKYDKVLRGEAYFTPEEKKGFILVNEMDKGDCLQCHTTDVDALGTTRQFSNNGLDDISNPMDYIDKGLGETTKNPKDYGKFKIPSLRNVALTAPYMHDGRFQTLEEVLDFYSDSVHFAANVDPKMGSAQGGGVHLDSIEKRQIIAFLHTLTDSSFTSNPAFANPFED